MIILVHTETTDATIGMQLGRAEYSYYFVLKAFRPLLEQLGIVIPVTDPAREVDRIYRNAVARGEACIFLSFSPPHRTEVGLACPTIPVFAWEFDSLPNEAWDADPRHDWVWTLRRLGRAIVHSQSTVDVVKAALGADFPVTCIPSPVWDRFEPSRSATVPQPPAYRRATMRIQGTVIDSQEVNFSVMSHDQDWLAWLITHRAGQQGSRRVSLDGVVYTSVFNPEDGRKNWSDMVACFCRTFAAEPRATLVLKLTHFDGTSGLVMMMRLLYRLAPFACRVVLMHGFLPEEDYAALVGVTAYVVNSAHGEGQCLPVMEFMSAGKPAVAPAHSGMSDYITPDCAFVVASSEEPSFWPQDPRRATRTMRHRIDAASLNQAYRDSLRLALDAPDDYRAMSQAATRALQRHSSAATVKERLQRVLESVPLLEPTA
jgi:glycosyltransferase involved in cell wall biosynthesis